MRDLIDKADILNSALNKLINGLAKDGVAIEGLVAACEASNKYSSARLEFELHLSAKGIEDSGPISSGIPCSLSEDSNRVVTETE